MRIKHCCWNCNKQYDCPYSYPDHPPDCELDSTWCSSTISIDYGKKGKYITYYCPAYDCEEFEPIRKASKTERH